MKSTFRKIYITLSRKKYAIRPRKMLARTQTTKTSRMERAKPCIVPSRGTVISPENNPIGILQRNSKIGVKVSTINHKILSSMHN